MTDETRVRLSYKQLSKLNDVIDAYLEQKIPEGERGESINDSAVKANKIIDNLTIDIQEIPCGIGSGIEAKIFVFGETTGIFVDLTEIEKW